LFWSSGAGGGTVVGEATALVLGSVGARVDGVDSLVLEDTAGLDDVQRDGIRSVLGVVDIARLTAPMKADLWSAEG